MFTTDNLNSKLNGGKIHSEVQEIIWKFSDFSKLKMKENYQLTLH